MNAIDILIGILTPDQIMAAMKAMEEQAKEKYFNVQIYYEKRTLDEDVSVADGFEEMFDSRKWENFLPSEYHKLKTKLHEQTKAA